MKLAAILYRLRLFPRIFHNLDKTILITLVLLSIINILIQYSANDQVFNRLINDVFYLFLSFILLLIVANTSINNIKNSAIPLYIISIILLIAVIFFGVKSHGVARWINIGVRLQPSELCKLAVPLILAFYFSKVTTPPKFLDFIKGVTLIIIPFALIAKQPDLGTGVLVLATGFFILFFVGLPWRLIIIALLLFIISTPIIWHFLHGYQKHRILTLINPYADPLGKGYHIIQGMIAVGSGGLFGKGYLHGTQIHLSFIPEKHTDFVISVLAEEMGFIGVIVVLMLYLILVLRGLKIMQHAQDIFTQALSGSIVLSLTLYVLINMGMVTGLFPVVGVPLPLISYGGTATIVLMLGFGILLAIDKQSKY
ncbi:MAG TPA: rod shape-determining protein RodA [Burkholderiales bacterium]|nr:rod shape-determining protein RodA [Burkholderiales bacterium]